MSTEVFEQVLRGTDLQLLYPLLDQLEDFGFDADEEVFYNGQMKLPLYHVLFVVNDDSDEYGRFSDYLGQVLLFIAAKTTPTKAIIEHFERYSSTTFRALDDLLKRYEGDKIRFSFSNPDYMNMILSYSVADLESPVQYFFARGQRGMNLHQFEALPIEVVILQLAKCKFVNKEKAYKEITKYYQGPPPRLEHLISIIENGEDFYSFVNGMTKKESMISRVRELFQKV